MKCFVKGTGYVVTLLCMLVAVGCGPPGTPASTGTSTTSTGAGAGGLYLAQKPPGMQAEIFAPGIVSDSRFLEWCGTFSPDGTEYYFYRYFGDSPSEIFATKLANGHWTPPEPCAFTEESSAAEPHLTFDDQRLYFNWKVAVPEGRPGYQAEAEYYFVERRADGWSEPQHAGQGMFMSSTRDGQIFTTDMSSRATGKTYLAKVETDEGVFKAHERLSIEPYYGSQAHPGIAPDGSYILFDVDGGSHLFVSFKQPDGTWGEAIDLTKHGFDPLAGGPYISPDGKYLFFALKDDIWWVDAKVIESLRPAKQQLRRDLNPHGHNV